ncbi:hypothetical protein, partial [Pseudomonas viridiflava]|uniref:hypothetical protein n=1 Tax=Pseudomonas viridiflava TaxID=33069 RepID=UPI0013CE80F1
AAGRDFYFSGGDFLNSKSNINAGRNISVNAIDFRNIGAIGGDIERTRIYKADGVSDNSVYSELDLLKAYNQRNNPEFPNIYYVGVDGELRLGV